MPDYTWVQTVLEKWGAKNKQYDSDLDSVIDLASIPDTLTGKDADSVDGVDLPNTIASVLTDHDRTAHDALGTGSIVFTDETQTLTNKSLSTGCTVLGADDLPNTIANLLTDHNLSNHEALGLRKITIDTSANKPASGTTTELYIETDTNIIYRGTGTGWQEIGRYVGMNFPNTIANVLTDHDKAAHDALGIDADTVDGEHASAFEHVANKDVADGYCGLDANIEIPYDRVKKPIPIKKRSDGTHVLLELGTITTVADGQ